MATIIKLKRSTSASSVPTVSDLVDGEVALNVVDKKIYVRNGSDIVEVANNNIGSGGGTDLSSVGTNIIPNVNSNYDIGSITDAFKDIFVNRNIKSGDYVYGNGKTKCNVFTNSTGLDKADAQFAFRVKVDNPVFNEVYTTSSGLNTKTISISNSFDDSNPAFLF